MSDDLIIENLGYARVSREEQAIKKHGLETQLNRLAKAGCTEIFQDVASGRSWGDSKRSDFQRIVELVKQKRVKKITVTALDRLSRESTTSAKFLQTLEETGVLIHELDSDRCINFIDPNEWYESRQKGLQAEYESRKTSKRVRDGYQNLRDLQKANPRIPYGYKRVNQEYKIDPDKAAIARETIDLYLSHKTLPVVTREIFEKYGKRWSVSGLRMWLLNPVLAGHTPYDKKKPKPANLPQGNQIIYKTHPDQALMSDYEQTAIAEILQENIRIWGRNRTAFINPFSGLVFCGECGSGCDLVSKPSGGKKIEFHRIRSFYCRTRSKNPAGKSCTQRSTYKLERIEALAIAALVKRAEQIANIAEIPLEQIESNSLRELRSQLTTLETMAANPAIAQAISHIKVQISNLEYKHDAGANIDTEKRSVLVETFENPSFFETLPEQDKKAIYRALIDRIVCKDGVVVSVELKI
jgi:DNA invertase Pin-like site-specific DNA recombinase